MVIVGLSGGLGNQMYQYSVGRALANARGAELRLDISHYSGHQREPELAQFRRDYQLSAFNIKAKVASDEDVKRVRGRFRTNIVSKTVSTAIRRNFTRFPMGHFRERTMNFDPVVLGLPDNVYLEGFFQSEQYFLSIAEHIRAELTPVDESITRNATEVLRKRTGDRSPVVSLHVRRGDIAYSAEQLGNLNLLYGVPMTRDYFTAAMARFNDCQLLVFSDDIPWCRANLRGAHLDFVEGQTDLQDFALMRACDHHIISNSTFSWWAAWLNSRPGKRVIAPRRWFTPGRYPGHRMESLIPPAWELI